MLSPSVSLSLALTGGVVVAFSVVGAVENIGTVRARRAVPLRVHINGTRGKSTTTNVIRNMFAAAGRASVAKITGEQPYIVDSSGDTIPWRRLGPARVLEQGTFLRWAARRRAEVAVIECMALRPEYQRVSEELIRAHIGVITNARLDHLEEMGRTRDSIAQSLAQMTPSNGVLVVGEARLARAASRIAERRNTRIINAAPAGRSTAIARAAALANGVLDAVDLTSEERRRAEQYLQALEQAPGAIASRMNIGKYRFIPLWTINDPDSLKEQLERVDWPAGPLCILFNHREDRPLRTGVFADLFAGLDVGIRAIIVMSQWGDGCRWFRKKLQHRVEIRCVGRSQLQIETVLEQLELPPDSIVVGCGNWKGVPENVR